MMTHSDKTTRLIGLIARPQGAALIAVMLLTMVLSAVGVMAMNNTFNSLRLSGNYRLRSQAMTTSDASLTLLAERAGSRPVNYLSRLRTAQRLDVNQTVATEQRQMIDRGGVATFDRASFDGVENSARGGRLVFGSGERVVQRRERGERVP